jgi:hypothetical protein
MRSEKAINMLNSKVSKLQVYLLNKTKPDAPPSSLLGPKRVQLCWRAEVVGTWCRSQLSALEGVEGRAEAPGLV